MSSTPLLVPEYHEDAWNVGAFKAATRGLRKTTLAEALTSLFFAKQLAGGSVDCKMGVRDSEGVYTSAKVDSLIENPDSDSTLETLRDVYDRSYSLYSSELCLGERYVTHFSASGVNQAIHKVSLSDSYDFLSYEEVFFRARNFGCGLKQINVSKGDKIQFFAETSMRWQMAMQGCVRQGVVVATTYANLGVQALSFAIRECAAPVVFADAALIEIVSSAVAECPCVKHVVFTSDRRPCSHRLYVSDSEVVEVLSRAVRAEAGRFGSARSVVAHSFEQICALGKKVVDANLEGQVVTLKASSPMYKTGELNVSCDGESQDNPANEPSLLKTDLAMIMYTSGSTGNPKGVCMSHENFVACLAGVCEAIPGMGVGDVYLAYLPLAHILEVIAETGSLANGVCIGYGSPKTLSDTSPGLMHGTCRGDAPTLRPTLMAAVPLVMDKIRSAVLKKVGETGGLKAKLFEVALKRKIHLQAKNKDGPLWNKLIFDPLRTRLLGGRVRYMLSGGGPLSKETQQFMNVVFNCPVGQGFGMTEGLGCVSTVWPNDRTFGRVGAPLISVKIKLEDWVEGGYHKENDEGEILVGGKQISRGYFNLPELTSESFFKDSDGLQWFRTGDIGRMHPDGVLEIIDRRKDLIKLSGGEYVSLGKLEPVYRSCPYVENLMIVADSSKSYVVCVCTPSADEKHAATDEFVQKELKRIGKAAGFASFEVPRRVLVVSEQWTPESDLVTAAMKLKRPNLMKRYSKEIANLYTA